MRPVILLLVLLLAGVVDGVKPCFEDNCQSGLETLNLSGCGLTDGDIPNVVACLDQVGRENIVSLNLGYNEFSTLPADLFQDLGVLASLFLQDNTLRVLPPGLFNGLGNLQHLYLQKNQLTKLPEGLFNELEELYFLYLQENTLNTLPPGVFDGLGELAVMYLQVNQLTTLPEGLFNELENLQSLSLIENDHLQCVPYTEAAVDVELPGPCGCSPEPAVMCDEGLDCAAGASGYTCEMATHRLGGELHLSDVRSTDIV